ncbi:MAG: sulfotransferase domain-containing protein, partial [Pseudomonadota bacterium]
RVARGEELTDDAVWATFQYALGLGQHGRYFWKRERPDASGAFFDTAGEDDLVPWWEPLAQSGARVAIFDLPKLRAGPVPGGLFVNNWLVHGRYGKGVVSIPAEAAGGIVSEPPGKLLAGRTRAEIDEAVKLKLKAALPQLRDKSWDLFAISFKEIHAASHMFWDFGDPIPSVQSLQPALVRAWTAVDKAIGALRAAAGEGCEVVLYSTTGMGRNRSLDHHADDIVTHLNGRLSARYRIRQVLRGNSEPFVRKVRYSESALALRIVPRVKVPRRRIVNFVIRELADMRVSDTGEAAFHDLVRPGDRYPGARAADLPDVIGILPEHLGQPRAIESTTMARMENAPCPLRKGNHSGDGFLISPKEWAPRYGIRSRIAIEEIGSLLSARVEERGSEGGHTNPLGRGSDGASKLVHRNGSACLVTCECAQSVAMTRQSYAKACTSSVGSTRYIFVLLGQLKIMTQALSAHHQAILERINFLVIGAQKAGTTWLYEMLRQHPDVFTPATKELHFFCKEQHYERGLGWYCEHFCDLADE